MSSVQTNKTEPKSIPISSSPHNISVSFTFRKKQQPFIGKLIKEGYLLKQAQVLKTWRKRFFQLRGNTLGYFTKEVNFKTFMLTVNRMHPLKEHFFYKMRQFVK